MDDDTIVAYVGADTSEPASRYIQKQIDKALPEERIFVRREDVDELEGTSIEEHEAIAEELSELIERTLDETIDTEGVQIPSPRDGYGIRSFTVSVTALEKLLFSRANGLHTDLDDYRIVGIEPVDEARAYRIYVESSAFDVEMEGAMPKDATDDIVEWAGPEETDDE